MSNGGIYQIRNIIDNKTYIGSAKVFEERKKRHFRALRGKYHHSILLQRAFDKYGEENFVFEILEDMGEINTEEDLNKLLEREQYWIDKNQPFSPNGYNISHGATNCVLYGEQNGMYGKRGENNPNFGRKDKPESFAIKSKAQKGRKVSDATKEKLSNIAKERYKTEKSPFYGKHWDEENKKRMSKQHSKAVLKLDKDTEEVLEEFENALIAKEITGIDNGSIGRVCADKQKTAGGYKWKFKE